MTLSLNIAKLLKLLFAYVGLPNYEHSSFTVKPSFIPWDNLPPYNPNHFAKRNSENEPKLAYSPHSHTPTGLPKSSITPSVCDLKSCTEGEHPEDSLNMNATLALLDNAVGIPEYWRNKCVVFAGTRYKEYVLNWEEGVATNTVGGYTYYKYSNGNVCPVSIGTVAKRESSWAEIPKETGHTCVPVLYWRAQARTYYSHTISRFFPFQCCAGGDWRHTPIFCTLEPGWDVMMWNGKDKLPHELYSVIIRKK
jgi:hypothetical protein